MDPQSGDDMSDEYELPRDCDFLSVGVNDATRSDCSPRLKGGITTKYKGIAINAPESIVWPKDFDVAGMMTSPSGEVVDSPLKFIVAGVARLPSNTLGLAGRFGHDVLVVAVNQETGQPYSGTMKGMGDRPTPGNGGNNDESAAVKSYFNLDLVHNLGVPIADGTYTVYATLGEYKSNVLTVEVRVE